MAVPFPSNCNVYKTITLQPGESFTLPPGAELVAADDATSITSVNDCAPTDDLEEYVCCAVTIAETKEINRQALYYYEIFLQGIRIGEVNYPFTPAGGYTVNSLGGGSAGNGPWCNLLKSTGLPIKDCSCLYLNGSNGNVDVRKFTFKTLPSLVGNNESRMSIYGIASNGRTGTGSTYIEYDVSLYDDRITDGRDYPPCV